MTDVNFNPIPDFCPIIPCMEFDTEENEMMEAVLTSLNANVIEMTPEIEAEVEQELKEIVDKQDDEVAETTESSDGWVF